MFARAAFGTLSWNGPQQCLSHITHRPSTTNDRLLLTQLQTFMAHVEIVAYLTLLKKSPIFYLSLSLMEYSLPKIFKLGHCRGTRGILVKPVLIIKCECLFFQSGCHFDICSPAVRSCVIS